MEVEHRVWGLVVVSAVWRGGFGYWGPGKERMNVRKNWNGKK